MHLPAMFEGAKLNNLKWMELDCSGKLPRAQDEK
jgi:hypothetical protein